MPARRRGHAHDRGVEVTGDRALGWAARAVDRASGVGQPVAAARAGQVAAERRRRQGEGDPGQRGGDLLGRQPVRRQRATRAGLERERAGAADRERPEEADRPRAVGREPGIGRRQPRGDDGLDHETGRVAVARLVLSTEKRPAAVAALRAHQVGDRVVGRGSVLGGQPLDGERGRVGIGPAEVHGVDRRARRGRVGAVGHPRTGRALLLLEPRHRRGVRDALPAERGQGQALAKRAVKGRVLRAKQAGVAAARPPRGLEAGDQVGAPEVAGIGPAGAGGQDEQGELAGAVTAAGDDEVADVAGQVGERRADLRPARARRREGEDRGRGPRQVGSPGRGRRREVAGRRELAAEPGGGRGAGGRGRPDQDGGGAGGRTHRRSGEDGSEEGDHQGRRCKPSTHGFLVSLPGPGHPEEAAGGAGSAEPLPAVLRRVMEPQRSTRPGIPACGRGSHLRLRASAGL